MRWVFPSAAAFAVAVVSACGLVDGLEPEGSYRFAGPRDDACAFEAEEAFCRRAGSSCGETIGTDLCGNPRTAASCGTCADGRRCSVHACVELACDGFEVVDRGSPAGTDGYPKDGSGIVRQRRTNLEWTRYPISFDGLLDPRRAAALCASIGPRWTVPGDAQFEALAANGTCEDAFPIGVARVVERRPGGGTAATVSCVRAGLTSCDETTCPSPWECGLLGFESSCGCVETHAEFCARLGFECGGVNFVAGTDAYPLDKCGFARTTDCGSCEDGASCSTLNRCVPF